VLGVSMTTIAKRLLAIWIRLVDLLDKAFSGESRPWRLVWRQSSTVVPQPTAPDKAVKHVGATETFGTELRALRQLELSPELVSDIETEMHWGRTWYEFERTMQAEIDRVFDRYLPAMECRDFGDLRDKLGLPESALN
jgi:hypothetical protein